jgi:outer membrane protein OmpA-like peptidoglycan-associated protein
MKARGIFLLFILCSISLILLYLYIFAKPLHLKQLEEERIANIQKVCMKEYPRNRAKGVLQRNVLEADIEIGMLLAKETIEFEPSSVSIDKNNTNILNQNKVVLKNIINVLNNMSEDAILSIATHTDKDGSSSKNLKLSQKRADVLKEYIRERTELALITSIGYGEELPLLKNKKNLPNRRVEISLRRIKE